MPVRCLHTRDSEHRGGWERRNGLAAARCPDSETTGVGYQAVWFFGTLVGSRGVAIGHDIPTEEWEAVIENSLRISSRVPTSSKNSIQRNACGCSITILIVRICKRWRAVRCSVHTILLRGIRKTRRHASRGLSCG